MRGQNKSHMTRTCEGVAGVLWRRPGAVVLPVLRVQLRHLVEGQLVEQQIHAPQEQPCRK